MFMFPHGVRSVLPRLSFLSFFVLLVPSLVAAEGDKVPLYAQEEMFNPIAGSLGSSFALTPFPAQGPLQHGVILDSYNFPALGSVLPAIKAAYEAGQPVVILSPTSETQALLDDITAGDVDLPEHLTHGPTAIGEPRLEAIAFRRPPGAATADLGEFWVSFDGRDGAAAEEKAEDVQFVASIADWIREAPAAAPSPAPRNLRAASMASGNKPPNNQPSIEKLTEGTTRKISFQFDKGSMATVIKSWAAYGQDQKEDWYIFEMTTTSHPNNFKTTSLHAEPRLFRGPELFEFNDDRDCKGKLASGCRRERYAANVEVKIAPKTNGMELMYYGPSSDRSQDEYTYTSNFSLGGKVTLGYGEKGVSAGGEANVGVQFGRSTKVTIKDATILGTGDPANEIAGWRIDMPPMRAVKDLQAYGGPSSDCENLLQMPYPVQQGSMETTQFAIYKLPEARRAGLSKIEMKVSLRLVEKSSSLTNPSDCNVFNCNCSPSTWLFRENRKDDTTIEFPLAAHTSK